MFYMPQTPTVRIIFVVNSRFRNVIKAEYPTAGSRFENAFKKTESDPSIAIGLANSALESIIKEILKNERINSKIKNNKTLYDLTSEILKIFQRFPSQEDWLYSSAHQN